MPEFENAFYSIFSGAVTFGGIWIGLVLLSFQDYETRLKEHKLAIENLKIAPSDNTLRENIKREGYKLTDKRVGAVIGCITSMILFGLSFVLMSLFSSGVVGAEMATKTLTSFSVWSLISFFLTFGIEIFSS